MKELLEKIELINPLHIRLTSNGYGEYPDSYKLTEEGINLILKTVNHDLPKMQ